MARTFVLGLDGASWLLLEPWIDDGTLPNIADLRETGTWAASRSCLPPVTFPNWKCYASGKDPGGFGVFWFERVDLAAGEISVCNGSDFDTPELWDYLNDDGLSAGVVNMPSTYPPRDIDALLVSGGPDAVAGEYRSLDEGYALPHELEDELEARFGYRVHPDPLLSRRDERGAEVKEILDLFETRFAATVRLMEERDLDFVHLTLFYLNVLHHFFWDDEPTRRGWQVVDEWVGRLAERDDLNLVLMSDHGSAPTQTEFYVNEWLAEHGYQVRTRAVDSYLRGLGVTRENALAVAKRLGVVDALETLVPDRVQQLVPQAAGLKRDRKLDAIDLQHTTAVASGQGPIYLTPHTDVPAVRDDLIADLHAIGDDHGPIFTAVHRSEDIYNGPYVDAAPEIVVEQRDGVHVNDGIGGGNVLTAPDRWAAENTNTGIFVANGPDIAATGERDPITITDLAPTILAGMGSAIPTDMCGDVLDIYETAPDMDTRDPLANPDRKAIASEAVTDRLTELGYME